MTLITSGVFRPGQLTYVTIGSAVAIVTVTRVGVHTVYTITILTWIWVTVIYICNSNITKLEHFKHLMSRKGP